MSVNMKSSKKHKHTNPSNQTPLLNKWKQRRSTRLSHEKWHLFEKLAYEKEFIGKSPQCLSYLNNIEPPIRDADKCPFCVIFSLS